MENLNSPSIFDHFRGKLKKNIYKNLGKNYVHNQCIITRILVDRLNSDPSKSVKLQFKSDVIA